MIDKIDIDKIFDYCVHLEYNHLNRMRKENFGIWTYHVNYSSKYYKYAKNAQLYCICWSDGPLQGQPIPWNDDFIAPKKYGIIYNEDGIIYDVDINIYNENIHLFVADDLNLL